MLTSGSAAFGAVVGWWLLLLPGGPVRLAVAVVGWPAAAAAAWLSGGLTALWWAIGGLAVGTIGNAVWRRLPRRSASTFGE